MAKYTKRSDGRYATSIIIGYGADGKAKRKVFYGKTIQELEIKTAEFKSLKNKGIIINDNGLTVGQWSEKWLELYKTDKAFNTFEMYRRTVYNHIIPTIGDVRLSALKKHHIQQMLNNIVERGTLRTAELVKLTMKQIINQAVIEEYIYKDITSGLSLPQKEKPVKRALTDIEKDIILNADLTLRQRVFVDILYYTGVRRGEALALTKNDIDLKNKTLTVSKNLVLKNTASEIKPSPKTKSGNRQIPLPDMLISSLNNYIPNLQTEYLFTKQNGEPMTHTAFRRFWDSITKALNTEAQNKEHTTVCELDNITPHIFRHTYATNLYNAGIDIKTAQQLLGHSSIQMTMDIYTHLDNTKILTAADRLNSFFDSQNIVNS